MAKHVDIDITVVAISEGERGAVLVSDGFQEVWVPKSLIQDCDCDYLERGQEIEITIPEWFATKENLV